jgi:DnaJ-class molecular chaperone
VSANGEAESPAAEAAAALCLACRGTGQVTSGLGGTPHPVSCPWCRGTGHRIPGIDAQEHPAEAGAGPPSEGSPA